MAELLEEVLEAIEEKGEDVEQIGLDDQQPEDELPEKYKGKTAKEIALMHQEAERLIGRQGSEVGELRKVVDEFIKAQTPKQQETLETITDTDFFTDPKETIKKAIDSHPSVKEAQANSLEFKRNTTLAKLERNFPDFMKTVEDPLFREWVGASRVRVELYNRAENQFDYDSAEELLATWKEKQEISKRLAETSKADRDQQLTKADVGTNGVAQTVSKKKYRRSDIVKLMQTNPDAYAARADEIMQAYAEGRVI